MFKSSLTLAFCLIASTLFAQGVAVNPTKVEFVPSADHDALSIDGSAMVVSYELRMFIESTDALISTTSLGKPVPVANLITVTNPVWFAGLTPRTKYVARVVAIGLTGEGISLKSNPFGNVGPPLAGGTPVVKK